MLPLTVSQDQGLEQTNSNGQEGVAVAAASSDYVSLKKNGDLWAGDGGISAESKAVAVAKIDQSADQDNSASQAASLKLGSISQSQKIGQRNSSEQSGLAVATAESDYVSVDNYGDVLNSAGDGIHAEIECHRGRQGGARGKPDQYHQPERHDDGSALKH